MAVGENTARASLTDAALTASMEFEFADPGEIVRISTLRYRDVKGVPVLTPWAGRFREYVRIEGMMIPMAAEVDWITPEGSVSVWRGRIMSARYEFAP